MVNRIWNTLAAMLYTFAARPEEKTVMKLKHWQEVNNGKLHKNVKFPLAGQVKKDGVYALVYVTACQTFIFNRTGREMVNVDVIKGDLNQALLPIGIYIGELCNEFCSLEVLSGIVNPNRTKPLSDEQAELALNHHLYLHDFMSVDEFINGKTTANYMQRHAMLVSRQTYCPFRYVSILPYEMLHNEFEVEAYARKCIDAGEEGAVFKPATIWEAGHKGWRMMKWVREVNYDLLCVGIEEGTGKYAGKVANLLFKWEGGKTIKAMLGKGWTHQDAERLFHAHAYADIDDNPVGKVYRVRGLSDSSKGVIRLPKVMEERHDKTVGDF